MTMVVVVEFGEDDLELAILDFHLLEGYEGLRREPGIVIRAVLRLLASMGLKDRRRKLSHLHRHHCRWKNPTRYLPHLKQQNPLSS